VEKKRAKETHADAKTKPGFWLDKDQLLVLIEKLKKDECIIGKEPDMSQIEDGFFETLFEEQTKDGPCTWEHFR
jgi:hypothetical protein